MINFIKKSYKSSVQLVQGERNWESLAHTLLNLVIKLRIAVLRKTQNGSGRPVVADLHFKNSAINEKLFGK